jgi:hypothetical protein
VPEASEDVLEPKLKPPTRARNSPLPLRSVGGDVRSDIQGQMLLFRRIESAGRLRGHNGINNDENAPRHGLRKKTNQTTPQREMKFLRRVWRFLVEVVIRSPGPDWSAMEVPISEQTDAQMVVDAPTGSDAVPSEKPAEPRDPDVVHSGDCVVLRERDDKFSFVKVGKKACVPFEDSGRFFLLQRVWAGYFVREKFSLDINNDSKLYSSTLEVICAQGENFRIPNFHLVDF